MLIIDIYGSVRMYFDIYINLYVKELVTSHVLLSLLKLEIIVLSLSLSSINNIFTFIRSGYTSPFIFFSIRFGQYVCTYVCIGVGQDNPPIESIFRLNLSRYPRCRPCVLSLFPIGMVLVPISFVSPGTNAPLLSAFAVG